VCVCLCLCGRVLTCMYVVISFGSRSSSYKSFVDAALFQFAAEVFNFLSSQ